MDEILEIQQTMHERGYWMSLKSPFSNSPEDGEWSAGFSQHDCSGWNGRPDYPGRGKTALEAVKAAYVNFEQYHPQLPPWRE